MRLDQAMLFVRDLDGMTAFYRDVMGFRPVEDTRLEDWVEFDTGGAGLSLHAIPAHIAETLPPSGPAPREQHSCKLLVSTDHLDADLARLRRLGVTLLQRPWGGWDAVDPEGNILGLQPRRA